LNKDNQKWKEKWWGNGDDTKPSGLINGGNGSKTSGQ